MRLTRISNRCLLFVGWGALTGCGAGGSGTSSTLGPVVLPSVPGEAASNGSAGAGASMGNGSAGATTQAMVPDVVFQPSMGNGSAGGGSDFDECVGEVATTEKLPPVLELLVDTSLSMNEMAMGSTDSKWTETRAALLTALDTLPAEASVGLTFYPDVNGFDMTPGGMCFDGQADVPIALLGAAASAQRTALTTAINNQEPGGATPTADAYRYAVAQLDTNAPTGSRFVVLITDGVPTFTPDCGMYDMAGVGADPIIADATTAFGNGIRTFVIGSPGSEGARDSLSQIASEGGTGAPGCSNTGPTYCHFDMTTVADFGAGLAQSLAEIASVVELSCSYSIPLPANGEMVDPELVNVTLTLPEGDPQPIGKDPSEADCTTGWQFAPNGTEVLLCGDTCTQVQQSKGTVALKFGCTTVIQ